MKTINLKPWRKKKVKTTLHYSTHCKYSDCSWSNWMCQAWKWQMASLLWVYRYIDIDIVYVHSTVYLWKNVKTLAIIKWLHHANRISFLKTSQTQHESHRENYLICLEYYLCSHNAVDVDVWIFSLLSNDILAVNTMCAFKMRQKWNGEIKPYCCMSIVYNSRHDNCGVLKARFEVCTKCFTS